VGGAGAGRGLWPPAGQGTAWRCGRGDGPCQRDRASRRMLLRAGTGNALRFPARAGRHPVDRQVREQRRPAPDPAGVRHPQRSRRGGSCHPARSPCGCHFSAAGDIIRARAQSARIHGRIQSHSCHKARLTADRLGRMGNEGGKVTADNEKSGCCSLCRTSPCGKTSDGQGRAVQGCLCLSEGAVR
jgi:hypothetical protein